MATDSPAGFRTPDLPGSEEFTDARAAVAALGVPTLAAMDAVLTMRLRFLLMRRRLQTT